MSRLTRFSALSASLLLLAAPAAWSCGELTGTTLRCAQAETAQAPTDATCAEDGQASMDCCVVHRNPAPEQSTAFESARVLLSLEVSSAGPAKALAVAQDLAATETSVSHRCGQERYVLFSSYLL